MKTINENSVVAHFLGNLITLGILSRWSFFLYTDTMEKVDRSLVETFYAITS